MHTSLTRKRRLQQVWTGRLSHSEVTNHALEDSLLHRGRDFVRGRLVKNVAILGRRGELAARDTRS